MWEKSSSSGSSSAAVAIAATVVAASTAAAASAAIAASTAAASAAIAAAGHKTILQDAFLSREIYVEPYNNAIGLNWDDLNGCIRRTLGLLMVCITETAFCCSVSLDETRK
jgi:hypothetical protein